MDNLVGTRVNLIAEVSSVTSDVNGVGRLLLKNIIVNGVESSKHHAWVRKTNRCECLVVGDIFSATSIVVEYLDMYDIKKVKYGFRALRNVTSVTNTKKV